MLNQVQWCKVQNDDNGSLFTGQHKLSVGSVVEICGENRTRTVTYIMGSDHKGWRACFRKQGAVPVGEVEWRVIPTAISSSKRYFGFHNLKGIVEFTATIVAIIGGLAAVITWLW